MAAVDNKSTYDVTWFFLYLLRQKLLEGVEDSGIRNDNWGMDLNLFLSLKHRHT